MDEKSLKISYIIMLLLFVFGLYSVIVSTDSKSKTNIKIEESCKKKGGTYLKKENKCLKLEEIK